jgi:hypothetical protein
MVFVISAAIRKVVVVYKIPAAQQMSSHLAPSPVSPFSLSGQCVFARSCPPRKIWADEKRRRMYQNGKAVCSTTKKTGTGQKT